MTLLLGFDVGNTNTVVGAFNNKELLFELRLKTDPQRTVDEYVALLGALYERKLGPTYKFSLCVLSSVVPPVTPDIIRVVREMHQLEPLLVGPGIRTGLQINISEPSSLGADRIVNAVAAKEIFGYPSLVIDFGTATSFDVIGTEGNYEGGIIAPGLRIALDALVRNTAKLPRIEMIWPKSMVGKNTVSAMQVGSVAGYVCMVDGLVSRLNEEVGQFKHVVATGGLGRVIAEHAQRVNSYDPHLTLKGLQILAERNR